MVVEYQQGEQEILALQERLLAKSPTMQKLVRKQKYGYSIIFLMIGLILGALNPAQRINIWMAAVVFALIWIYYYPHLLVRSLRKNSRKILSQAKEQGVLGRQWLSLSERGITIRSEVAEAHHSWKSVGEIAESKHHVFIHVGPSKAYAVPKAAFAEAGSLAKFMQLCEQYRSR